MAHRRLLRGGPLDAPDALEQRWAAAADRTNAVFAQYDAAAAHSRLQAMAADSPAAYDTLCLGLSHATLTVDDDLAEARFDVLSFVVRDGYAVVAQQLVELVRERFQSLLFPVQRRLCWLATRLVAAGGAGCDALALMLLRQVPCGSTQDERIAVAGDLVDFLDSARDWLLEQPALVTATFFSLLRLAQDHTAPQLAPLRAQEVALCLFLWQEQNAACLAAGCDLVRVLPHLPECKDLWAQLDPAQVLAMRRSRRVLLSRVPPQAETWLIFLLTKVRMGHQARYLSWFEQRFFASPGAESLVPDLVRFVCAVYDPQGVAKSGMVPRWAILAWLLTHAKSEHGARRALEALYLDYCAFGATAPNLALIEPPMLLAVQSLERGNTRMAATILAFLLDLPASFGAGLEQSVRASIGAALEALCARDGAEALRVVAEHHALGPRLRARLVATYPAIGGSAPAAAARSRVTAPPPAAPAAPPLPPPDVGALLEAAAAGDSSVVGELLTQFLGHDFTPTQQITPDAVAAAIAPLLAAADTPSDAVVAATNAVVGGDVKDRAGALVVAMQKQACAEALRTRILVASTDNLALYVALLAGGVETLADDLAVLAGQDLDLYFDVAAAVFLQLADLAVGHPRIIHTLVVTVDPRLHVIHRRLAMGEFVVVGGAATLPAVARASLAWDSFEQRSFWALVAMECYGQPPAHRRACVALLGRDTPLTAGEHQEALDGLLVVLREVPATVETVQPVLELPLALWPLSVGLLAQWTVADGLAPVLAQLLVGFVESAEKANPDGAWPDAEPCGVMLAHLARLEAIPGRHRDSGKLSGLFGDSAVRALLERLFRAGAPWISAEHFRNLVSPQGPGPKRRRTE